jgi:predicted dithiol-disulfide oxidoreductase (DUF899 family)
VRSCIRAPRRERQNVSRAPLAQIEAFKKRMGWRFKWVSSYGSDFNRDYQVSFGPEDIAKGKVQYNTICATSRAKSCRAARVHQE